MAEVTQFQIKFSGESARVSYAVTIRGDEAEDCGYIWFAAVCSFVYQDIRCEFKTSLSNQDLLGMRRACRSITDGQVDESRFSSVEGDVQMQLSRNKLGGIDISCSIRPGGGFHLSADFAINTDVDAINSALLDIDRLIEGSNN